jgi:hypothetical protein
MTFPVLPLRPGVVEQDMDTVYRFLQALSQQASVIATALTYVTFVPTATDIEEGQAMLSLIAGKLAIHVNSGGSILTLNLGEPLA